MQQIQLNLIPYKPVIDNFSFVYYDEKQKRIVLIYWDMLYEGVEVIRVLIDQVYSSVAFIGKARISRVCLLQLNTLKCWR